MGIGAIIGRTFTKRATKAAGAAGAATKGVFTQAVARTKQELADCFVSRRALNQQKKTLKAQLKDISKRLKASISQETSLKEKLTFQKCAEQAEKARKLIQEKAALARKQVAEAMKNKFNGKMKVENYTSIIKDGKAVVEPAGSHTLTFKDGKIVESVSDKGRRVTTSVKNGIKTVYNQDKGVATTLEFNAAGKPSMITKNPHRLKVTSGDVTLYEAPSKKTIQMFNYGPDNKLNSITTAAPAPDGRVLETTRHINWLPDGTVAKYIS